MTTTNSCLNCGWGVSWEVSGEHRVLVGTCCWECPVPAPACFGTRYYFAGDDEPVADCPAWKPAERPELMQGWAEHPDAYHARQCWGCVHRSQLKQVRPYGTVWTGRCLAGVRVLLGTKQHMCYLADGKLLDFATRCPRWEACDDQ